MTTVKTKNGWVDTVVTTHNIKLCKAVATVKDWNEYNLKNPEGPYRRFICARCKTFWSSITDNQYVSACIMDKAPNQWICDTCVSEIDQTLIIK